MGWKNIKDHYDIKHIVCVQKMREYGEEPMIMIGSPYITNIIVIRPSDGKILKRYKDGHINEHLRNLQPRLDEDEKNGKLKELIDSPDKFDRLLPVYYYGGHKHIWLKYCEHYGYPNCTTDGMLMYKNTFCSKRRAAQHYLLNNSRINWRRWWRYGVRERFRRINEEIKMFFKYDVNEIWESVYVRCWGRFFVKKGGNNV